MSAAERGKTERKQPEPKPTLVTAAQLSAAWVQYLWLFNEVPHGTEKQMAALLELIPKGR